MTNPKDPTQWLSLGQIRERIPSGSWHHSPVFEQVGAGIESGVPEQSKFLLMHDFDKAYIIAYHRVKSTMAAYENWLHEEKMKRSK